MTVQAEATFTRRQAQRLMECLQFKLNLHLLKLVAVPRPDQHAQWRQEVAGWLEAIAAIRFKRSIKGVPASFYSSILFDEPFGSNEIGAVLARLELLRHKHGEIREGIQPADFAARLRSFHEAFADGCARREMQSAMIRTLIDAFQCLAVIPPISGI